MKVVEQESAKGEADSATHLEEAMMKWTEWAEVSSRLYGHRGVDIGRVHGVAAAGGVGRFSEIRSRTWSFFLELTIIGLSSMGTFWGSLMAKHLI